MVKDLRLSVQNVPSQYTHKYKRAKEVNVDECYNCGAFFLDSGELTDIRDNYMSDAEVTAYADQIINSIPEYAQAVKNLDAKKNGWNPSKSLQSL